MIVRSNREKSEKVFEIMKARFASLLTLGAVFVAANTCPATAKDGEKEYYKQQEKREKSYEKYERKSEKEWRKRGRDYGYGGYYR